MVVLECCSCERGKNLHCVWRICIGDVSVVNLCFFSRTLSVYYQCEDILIFIKLGTLP